MRGLVADRSLMTTLLVSFVLSLYNKTVLRSTDANLRDCAWSVLGSFISVFLIGVTNEAAKSRYGLILTAGAIGVACGLFNRICL